MDVPSMIMGAAIASVVWIVLWPRRRDRDEEDLPPRG
ncbi:hypothetical protein FHR75_001604 [Kineococcus radiotolerans]|uniref:Uncharacterized protein n=1 Tax=Kineococcus radiotolerans TaxID=131568 RepID=A0A7W4TKY1_KINRA|nr:hypothetical protein [Kineococcus radiotolerans]